MYYQIKNPPTDEAEIAALKDKLIPCNTLEPCTYINALGIAVSANRTRVTRQEFITVKYDFRELWRWATILDRFALSQGNTIGIMKAVTGTNIGGYPRGTLWPVEGFTDALEDGYGILPRTVRETVLVWSRDPQRTADALPVLLPQLGIPVDAVGVVAYAGAKR